MSWWLRELGNALPARVRRMLEATRRPVPVLEFSRHWVRLFLGGEALTGELAATLPDIGDAERQQIIALSHQRFQGSAVVLRLQKPLILEREISLPLAAEASLPAIVRHQIPKLAPIAAEDVAIHHRIVGRDASSKTLRVRVTLAKHTSLQRARQVADDLGLPFNRIVAGQPDDRQRSGPTMWLAEARSGERRRARLHRTLEVAAASLFVIAYGLHIARTQVVQGQLSRDLVRARLEAADVRSLAAKVAAERAWLQYLVARRASVPTLAVLDNLTRSLPTDSWVSQFTLEHGAVQITGASRDADALIGRIEASSLFEAPRFTSATTLSPAGDGQRFELAFSVKQARP